MILLNSTGTPVFGSGVKSIGATRLIPTTRTTAIAISPAITRTQV